jgi:hypothetical protein
VIFAHPVYPQRAAQAADVMETDMERDNNDFELIDLGAASAVTRGNNKGNTDNMGGRQNLFGLSDD